MTLNRNYTLCFHGAWLYENFGDHLLKMAAEEVTRILRRKTGREIISHYAKPVFLGGQSCHANADLHIFWSGTQHFFHISNMRELIRDVKIHYFDIPIMFRNAEFREWLNSKSKAQILFIGSGFGPFMLPFLPTKKILKKYLAQSSFISVRDIKSKLYTKHHPRIIADPVASMFISMKLTKQKVKSNSILIAPRSWNNNRIQRRQRNVMRKIMNEARKEGVQVRFFFSSPSDYENWKMFISNYEYRIWNRDDLGKTLAYISQHSKVITARWHVAMVSKFLGATVISINIERKLKVLGPYVGEVVFRMSKSQAKRFIVNPLSDKENSLLPITLTLDNLSAILISKLNQISEKA